MKVGVIVFPGSNCDHDAWYSASQAGYTAEFIWHDSSSLNGVIGGCVTTRRRKNYVARCHVLHNLRDDTRLADPTL